MMRNPSIAVDRRIGFNRLNTKCTHGIQRSWRLFGIPPRCLNQINSNLTTATTSSPLIIHARYLHRDAYNILLRLRESHMYKIQEMKTPHHPIIPLMSSSSVDQAVTQNTSSISTATVISTKQQQPAWEILLLVSHLLDPKTLAIASCVSKTWSRCMAQDHLWHPMCLSRFPSISHLRHFDPTISYRRLYALAHSASKHRRPIPVQPHISLHDLIFAVDVSCHNGRRVLSVGMSGAELLNNNCASGVWQFNMRLWESDCQGWMEEEEDKEGVNVTWTVVLKDWKAAFFMMEGKGKGKIIGGNGMWFSEELPSPGCCSMAAMSGLVAEVGLEFRGEERVRVEKVSLGLMCVMSWRYVSVDDGLRYLQHFLLPSTV